MRYSQNSFCQKSSIPCISPPPRQPRAVVISYKICDLSATKRLCHPIILQTDCRFLPTLKQHSLKPERPYHTSNVNMTDFHPINGWGQQQDAFSPIDPAFQWDFTGVQSPKTMVSHYNDVSYIAICPSYSCCTDEHPSSYNGLPASMPR